MAFRQIKSPALANQAVIDTKLDASSVSGQTATTSANNLDAFLLHDNATSALKSITAANFIGSLQLMILPKVQVMNTLQMQKLNQQ